jgi:hypothetical protein
VSLPTPFAITSAFLAPEALPMVAPPYERAMVREVERLCAAIPHRDLAIFGIATECGMARGRSRETVRDLLRTHAAAVDS